MKNDERITVILGAGAMMDVTTLSCKTITETVIAKKQDIYTNGEWKKISFLQEVYDCLQKYYGNERDLVNFEDIFHTLEMWRTIKNTKNEKTIKAFRSVFGMLCDIKDEFGNKSDTLIYKGIKDLIDTVIGEIASFEKKVYDRGWFPEFFLDLQRQKQLDVFTLNYDTWLEQILETYNDGFLPVCETHQKFMANQLFQNEKNLSTVNHLHGQICFTSHIPIGVVKHRWGEWYKANDYDVVNSLKIHPKHLGNMATTQAAEQVYQYPIITGLRKNDKILTPPFDAYYVHLYEKMQKNKNLLIIGYGFSDLYINSLLSQFRDFHGENGRVICISYLSADEWVYNMGDMPLSNTMKRTIYSMFRDNELPYRFLERDSCDYVESKTGNSRLYLCGFESSASAYKDDILQFYDC